jgi:hypothetical protein
MVLHRHEQFTIKSKKSRPGTVLADQNKIIATYTLDKDYIAPVTLADNTTGRKILPLGTILALNPTTKKVVPNYTTYNFGVIGPLLHDADCGWELSNYDRVVEVVWRGEVLEKHCWDNGTYGTVLDATKAALSGRINFVKLTGVVSFQGRES